MARPPLIHSCTIDVEDYYHVSAFERAIPRSEWASIPERVTASTEIVLELMADVGVRGTFFVLGRVAERSPGLVKRIRTAGHEIACHSNDHRMIHGMTPAEFRTDLRTSKRRLEDLTGERVVAYRAPTFSIDPRSFWAFEILIEEGFAYDSSVFPVVHDRYGMPDAPPSPFRVHTPSGSLTEFPLTTFRTALGRWPAVGGGYFRLYPYRLNAWAVRHSEAEGRPANLFVHPWEFDPDQPRVNGIGLTTRIRHYVGLRKTAARFARMLRDFPFGTMTESLAALPEIPTFRLGAERFEPTHAVRLASPRTPNVPARAR